jgi:hypothetical protein
VRGWSDKECGRREALGRLFGHFIFCCIRVQVEEGVAMILVSERMGCDPGTLHVKMTSLVSTTLLDVEGRY